MLQPRQKGGTQRPVLQDSLRYCNVEPVFGGLSRAALYYETGGSNGASAPASAFVFARLTPQPTHISGQTSGRIFALLATCRRGAATAHRSE